MLEISKIFTWHVKHQEHISKVWKPYHKVISELVNQWINNSQKTNVISQPLSHKNYVNELSKTCQHTFKNSSLEMKVYASPEYLSRSKVSYEPNNLKKWMQKIPYQKLSLTICLHKINPQENSSLTIHPWRFYHWHFIPRELSLLDLQIPTIVSPQMCGKSYIFSRIRNSFARAKAYYFPRDDFVFGMNFPREQFSGNKLPGMDFPKTKKKLGKVKCMSES